MTEQFFAYVWIYARLCDLISDLCQDVDKLHKFGFVCLFFHMRRAAINIHTVGVFSSVPGVASRLSQS